MSVRGSEGRWAYKLLVLYMAAISVVHGLGLTQWVHALVWVLAVVFLVLRRDAKMFAMGLFLPLEAVVMLTEGVSVYTFFIGIMTLMSLNRRHQLVLVIGAVVLIAQAFLSTLVGIQRVDDPDLRGLVNTVVLFAWIGLSSEDLLRRDLNRSLEQGLVIGTLVSGLVAVGVYSTEILALNPRLFRFAGLRGDPNYYAMYGCVSVAMLLGTDKLLGRRWRDYAIIAVLSGFVLLTYSKTGLVTLVGVLTLYVVSRIIKEIKGRRAAAVVGWSFVTVLMTFALLGNPLAARVYERTSGPQGLLTGRLDIWEGALQAVAEDPNVLLLGIGPANVNSIMERTNMGRAEFLHNVYLEYLVGSGIVGLIGTLAFQLMLFGKKLQEYRGGAERLAFALVLIAMLVPSFSLSLGYRKAYWLVFFV